MGHIIGMTITISYMQKSESNTLIGIILSVCVLAGSLLLSAISFDGHINMSSI